MTQTTALPDPPPTPRKPWWKKKTFWASVPPAIILIGAIVALVSNFLNIREKIWPPHSPLPPIAALKIDAKSGDVPRCISFEGNGAESAEKQIWLAYRVESDPSYFLRPTSPNGEGRWKTGQFTMGGETGGKRYEVVAFYLPNELSEFIKTISTRSKDPNVEAYWYIQAIPKQATDIAYIDAPVTRSLQDTKQC